MITGKSVPQRDQRDSQEAGQVPSLLFISSASDTVVFLKVKQLAGIRHSLDSRWSSR